METEVERIGLGAFHYTAAVICGLGNASDAVELLAIGCVLCVLSMPQLSARGAPSVGQGKALCVGEGQ